MKLMYSVWNFVGVSWVYLHDEGYFTFLFDTIEDSDLVMAEIPYTYSNRSMVLRNWVKDFKFQPKMLRVIPLQVIFPGLPLYCCTEENLGRNAS